MTDIIAELKALPFTLEVSQDTQGVFVQTVEFPEAYDEEATYDEALRTLAASLKDWARYLSDDVDEWRKGREQEVPYLLKILVSSEEELDGIMGITEAGL